MRRSSGWTREGRSSSTSRTVWGGVIGEQYAEEGGQGRVRIVDHGPSADDPCARFTDVDRSAWYHDAIDWALENGALHGIGGHGSHDAGRLTFRARRWPRFCTTWRAIRQAGPTGAAAFTDCDAGAWYAEAVAWARGAGRPHRLRQRLVWSERRAHARAGCRRDHALGPRGRAKTSPRVPTLRRSRMPAKCRPGRTTPCRGRSPQACWRAWSSPTGKRVLNAQGAVTRAEMAALLMRLM